MVNADEDALICDFAAEYGIYDWRALPRTTAATLAFGLSDDSRIKRCQAGAKLTTQTALLAIIADRLGTLCWLWSNEGERPKSLLGLLLGEEEAEKRPLGFGSPEEFEAARAALLKKVKDNDD